ncbi:MAG: acyl-ACP--UDP-N-acetylglucosamine O-acyltransferase [Myxococcales bacterium]|nr:acyl-ACP--UDP-N-acetylglucosamine O-acyltransferase [Myxococcales bacterium]
MQGVHPTALVHEDARLDDGVRVGPYCVVGPRVRIGQGTVLESHVVLEGQTTLGARNRVHPFAVLGADPQVSKRRGAFASALHVGDDNVFREHVTVNVGSGEGDTRIGDRNLFMAGCHVAHDVLVGSGCVVANGVQLAGHVVVEDGVTFGGLSAVAQRLTVGVGAFVAGGAMCERDVPPFVIVQGDRARVRALNVVGLARRGQSAESIARMKKVFRALFVARAEPSRVLEELCGDDDDARLMVRRFVEARRGRAPVQR